MMKSRIGAVIGSVVVACAIAASGVSTAAPNPAAKPAAPPTPQQKCEAKAAKGFKWVQLKNKDGTPRFKADGTTKVMGCRLAKAKKPKTCMFVAANGQKVAGKVKTLANGKQTCVRKAMPKKPPKKCRIGRKVKAGKCAKAA